MDKIDAILAIEREIYGLSPEERLAVRLVKSAPLMEDLKSWLEHLLAEYPEGALAKAAKYMLSRWNGFTTFLEDVRICLTNNAAERQVKPVAMGRKSWLFAGSMKGLRNTAVIMSLINTCELNGVDPEAWLGYVLTVIQNTEKTELWKLLPWNCKEEVLKFKQES